MRELFDRALLVPKAGAGLSSADVGLGIVGIDPQGLGEILDRALLVPKAGAGITPAGVGPGTAAIEVEIEPQGLGELLDCALRVPKAGAGMAPPRIGVGIVGVDAQRPSEILNRALRIASSGPLHSLIIEAPSSYLGYEYVLSRRIRERIIKSSMYQSTKCSAYY